MSVKGKHNKRKKRSHSSNDSDSDSEHELFYYRSDRVRLMKHVLKILKLKKIKALAPEGIKHLDMEEMNTMLLEELLGISNKRLKKIFEGQNADDASSSSDEDKADIISLDSISDDEIVFIDEKKEEPNKRPKCRHKKHKVKKEAGESDVKIEKDDKIKKEKSKEKEKVTKGLENEKILSVLELLELQARARAIRSQLALEAVNKAKEAAAPPSEISDDDDDVAVIIETPSINEIVISSSDSEHETNAETSQKKNSEVVEVENNEKQKEKSPETIANNGETESVADKTQNITANNEENLNQTELDESTNTETSVVKKPQKIKLIRSIIVEPSSKIEINSIPLPTEQDQNKVEISQDKTNENDKSEIVNFEEQKTNEINQEEVKNTEDKDSNIENDAIEIIDTENEESVDNKKDLTKQTEKINIVSDNEDDVIRLDIVEIDGIDY